MGNMLHIFKSISCNKMVRQHLVKEFCEKLQKRKTALIPL